jgi:phospholipase D1/2
MLESAEQPPQKSAEQPPRKVGQTRVLITAAEAFPEFERAFLNAEREIWGSFRVFDLWTRLRTDAARDVGETWLDLMVHTLKRGVQVNMAVSDFDPIMAPVLHRETWKSIRAFLTAEELAGRDAKLNVVAAAHPTRIGMPHRLLFWPWVWRRLRDAVDDLNEYEPGVRQLRLEGMPGLQRHVVWNEDGTLRAKKWPPADPLPVTHHQKIAVFDRERLYIGGLDLDERRYDDPDHSRRRDETWHDIQVMIDSGPEIAEAQDHLERFLAVTNGQDRPAPSTRLLTTLSRKRTVATPFLGPKPLSQTIARAHHARISAARKLIYLETQFFRDTHLAEALAQAARNAPGLGLVLIVPGAPEDVAFDGSSSSDARFGEYLQAKAVDTVLEAFGPRVAICSPVRPVAKDTGGRDCLAGSPIVYVHAKASIFDDNSAIVSSANLNGRSLCWDTEAGVELTDRDIVRELRRRMLEHWLGEPLDEAFASPDGVVAAIRQRAEDNLAARPEERRGFLVPYDPEPARDFGRRIPFVPEAMV